MTDTPKTIAEMTDAEIGALVRAENDGKQIQIWLGNDERWFDSKQSNLFPQYAYRIKPEPVRETVKVYGLLASDGWAFTSWSCDEDTHTLTFETIDGEPTGPAHIEAIK